MFPRDLWPGKRQVNLRPRCSEPQRPRRLQPRFLVSLLHQEWEGRSRWSRKTHQLPGTRV